MKENVRSGPLLWFGEWYGQKTKGSSLLLLCPRYHFCSVLLQRLLYLNTSKQYSPKVIPLANPDKPDDKEREKKEKDEKRDAHSSIDGWEPGYLSPRQGPRKGRYTCPPDRILHFNRQMKRDRVLR